MKHLILIFIVIALFILHQDFWFWRAATPIVFGFLPIGLFYHVCYTIVVSLLMWLLVKYAWPSHLEERAGEGEARGQGDKGTRRQGDEESVMQGDKETRREGEPSILAFSPLVPLSPCPLVSLSPSLPHSSHSEGCE
jgi:hypothetical protein